MDMKIIIKGKSDMKKMGIKSVDKALKMVEKYVEPVPYIAIMKTMFFGDIQLYMFKLKQEIKHISSFDDDNEDCPVNKYSAPPFLTVSLCRSNASTKIGSRTWGGVDSTLYKVDDEWYMTFNQSYKHESIINLLSILWSDGHRDAEPALKLVIFDAINKQFSVNIQSVELAGVDDIINRCMNIINAEDSRLIPRHILLAGVAGCGKSEVMKEIIRQTPEWVHYSLQGRMDDWSEFMQSLNKLMTFLDKKVMILVDEIDEIGLTREKDRHGTYELLRVMDGVGDMGNIKFIATTNRPADLDPALKRVGRFSPIIVMGTPDDKAFEAIVSFYAKRYNAKVDANKIAKSRDNAVGADIRASFEDCIIQHEPITTENVLKNLILILEAKKVEQVNYM